MTRTATYHTSVVWKGEHWGHLTMGNGPQMMFSAPSDAHGHAGVLTPEDAFVASANTHHAKTPSFPSRPAVHLQPVVRQFHPGG